MKKLTLPRVARLKSQKAIDRLFMQGRARKENPGVFHALSYPLRVCSVGSEKRDDGYEGVRIMISVPKKKVRHAVDRVKVRRRVREAWRLSGQRENLGRKDVALIYVADKVESYWRINDAIKKIITKLQAE